MTAPNHIIGGVVVTGVFGGIAGINILEKWEYIIICIVFSLLPDIDHPGSIMGRVFKPISKFINRNYGHRTITHNLAALGVVCFFAWLVSKGLKTEAPITFLVFGGYFSHLIFDMMTVAGVPLFYPWALNPCVIPGKPEARFNVSDVKSEARIFGFFGICFFLMMPLMEQGFWTSYNRTFGTQSHLKSEYNASLDLLEVEYSYKMGSQEFNGKAYVIEAGDNKTTLLENREFKFLDKTTMQAISVIPSHTNKKLKFETKSFVSIDADSLNRLTVDSLIMEIEIVANNDFQTSTYETGKKYKGAYLKNFFVENIFQESEKETFISRTNPRIVTLETRIKNLEEEEREMQRDFQQQEDILKSLKSDLNFATEIYEKEKLMQAIKVQEKNMNSAFENGTKIRELKTQILELKQSDRIQNSEKRFEVEIKNRENQISPTRLSGIIKYLIITK
ncbi:MAG: metal-dependent hydrolase [Saprospiraceae bacterium]